ncbi:MAG TPA: LuxR family transcriptional regulator [Alphaproteobacteria bacterium]|nr:LuxR family transcriptional regulator [Alphaproteobacteria bacterium]
MLDSNSVIDPFIMDLYACTDLGELGPLFHKAFSDVGFSISAYTRLNRLGYEELSSDVFTQKLVLVTTFPSEWRARYNKKNYHQIDPIYQHCQTSTASIGWRQAARRRDLAPVQCRLFSEAHDFGLADGLAIPLHGPSGGFAVVSLSANELATKFNRIVEAKRHTAHLMAIHFHAVVERMLELDDDASKPIELTEREIECIKWSALGKSSWEISQILSLSERTVNFHMGNAIRKLDVSNRTHAVAKSIYYNLISL